VVSSPSFLSLEKAYLSANVFQCQEKSLKKMKYVETEHFQVRKVCSVEQKERFDKLALMATAQRAKCMSCFIFHLAQLIICLCLLSTQPKHCTIISSKETCLWVSA
jgi:hypothetical protein